MTFAVPLQTLVIGDSHSARLLVPLESFLSAAKPETRGSALTKGLYLCLLSGRGDT